MNKKFMLLSVLASAALTACGGGGGGEATENEVQLPTTPTVITAENAKAVSGVSYSMATQLADASTLDALLPVGVETSTAETGLLEVAATLLKKRPESKLVVGAETETYHCTGGGSVTYSGTETLVTVSANNCAEDGYTANGKATVQLHSETATGFAATISFSSFIVAQASTSVRANGTMTVTYDENAGDVSMQMASSSFRVNVVQGSSNWAAEMTDYSASHEYDGAQSIGSADFSYAAAGTGITPVAASVDTTVPFATQDTETHPHAGSMLITGSDSSVLLTVIDSTNVRLELDADGDGDVDETINTTWGQILPS